MSKTLENLLNLKTWGANEALRLVELGEEPSSKNSKGDPLVHALLEKFLAGMGASYFDAVLSLIKEHGIEVGTQNSKGLTLLQVLLNHSSLHFSEALSLTELGADPTTKNSRGQPLIHLVMQNMKKGTTASEQKAKKEQQKQIKSFVTFHHVDINSKDEDGLTPLQVLVRQDIWYTSDALFLVGLGAEFESPLLDGQPLIQILLNFDKEGTQSHNLLAVKELAHKAKLGINGKNQAGLTALENYLNSGNSLSLNTLVALFQLGADSNTRTANGDTALHLLGKNGVDVSNALKNLIEVHKIDENIKNKNGETALMVALNSLLDDKGSFANADALMTATSTFGEDLLNQPQEVSKLNRLMTRLHAKNTTASYNFQGKIRDAAFNAFKNDIEDLDVEVQLTKLQWARKQPLFCMHRSHFFLATIGRTRTVTLIDKMIADCERKIHDSKTLVSLN